MKSVRFGEVENLMNQMMRTPIVQIGNQKIFDDMNSTLNPNLIMDARHHIIREPEPISHDKSSTILEATRLLMDEKTKNIIQKREQEFLKSELIKFEKQLTSTRPKFSDSYTCSKRKIPVNSDDEELWLATRRAKVKIKNFRRASAPIFKKSEKKEDILESNAEQVDESYISSIKVTITDKPISESKENDHKLLKWVFHILNIHMKEAKRLRELKTKVQENLASRKLKRFFETWRTTVKNSKDFETRKKEEQNFSDERKIELFVNAITEKQKRLEKVQKNILKEETLKMRSKNAINSAEFVDIKNSRNSANKVINIVEPPLQNRLNAQKKIIAEQRMKLAEQNRIIEDMKLKQIEEESRRAGRETICAAKEALTNCGQRTRRTLIQLMKEEGYRDKSVVDPPRLPSPPRFLMRMEARAEARRERTRRTEEERRRKIEEQKLKEEATRKKEEDSRKQLQLEAQREAKKIREEQEKRKARHAEKMKVANELADAFYKRYLLRNYIMDPFLKLIESKHHHMEKAINHYEISLLKGCFINWKNEIQKKVAIKEELCLSIYQRNQLFYFFREWKNWTKNENRKRQVACDFYDLKLQEKYMKNWCEVVAEMRVKYLENNESARNYYEGRMKIKCFQGWKKFLEISSEVKESDKRKDYWRELVQRVVPDFAPKYRGVIIDD